MWRNRAMPSLCARMMDLGYDEIASGRLVAAVRVLDPEGGFALVDVKSPGGGGGKGCWWDVPESGAEDEGAFFGFGDGGCRNGITWEDEGGFAGHAWF